MTRSSGASEGRWYTEEGYEQAGRKRRRPTSTTCPWRARGVSVERTCSKHHRPTCRHGKRVRVTPLTGAARKQRDRHVCECSTSVHAWHASPDASAPPTRAVAPAGSFRAEVTTRMTNAENRGTRTSELMRMHRDALAHLLHVCVLLVLVCVCNVLAVHAGGREGSKSTIAALFAGLPLLPFFHHVQPGYEGRNAQSNKHMHTSRRDRESSTRRAGG